MPPTLPADPRGFALALANLAPHLRPSARVHALRAAVEELAPGTVPRLADARPAAPSSPSSSPAA